MKKTRIALVLAAFIGCLIIGFGYISIGKTTACDTRELCSAVVRPHFPARHWDWSGIFPFEGGFIPDPHFSVSQEMDLPDSTRRAIGSVGGKFQIVEVNPGFDDGTSEELLLMGTDQAVLQFPLDLPKGQHVRAVLGYPELPNARLIPYQGKLALISDFFGPAKGAFLLDLPLRSGQRLTLIPSSDSRFTEVMNGLKAYSTDESLMLQFCKTNLPFAAMWENSVGFCNWTPAEYSTNPSVHDFNGFWRSEKP